MDNRIKTIYMLSLLCDCDLSTIDNHFIIAEILFRYGRKLDMPTELTLNFIKKYMILRDS